eukprot:scaffold4871_cov260-Pinguiococcus_pyrenoidosus.AAC.2
MEKTSSGWAAGETLCQCLSTSTCPSTSSFLRPAQTRSRRSYLGAERAVPGYSVMGPAKAALEVGRSEAQCEEVAHSDGLIRLAGDCPWSGAGAWGQRTARECDFRGACGHRFGTRHCRVSRPERRCREGRATGAHACLRLASAPVQRDLAHLDATELRSPPLCLGLQGSHPSPEEVARVAAFLSGPLSSGISGQVIYVDGGFSAGSFRPANSR